MGVGLLDRLAWGFSPTSAGRRLAAGPLLSGQSLKARQRPPMARREASPANGCARSSCTLQPISASRSFFETAIFDKDRVDIFRRYRTPDSSDIHTQGSSAVPSVETGAKALDVARAASVEIAAEQGGVRQPVALDSG